MRGRKPKPTKLKILRGNPGKRRIKTGEPEPKGVPTCPGCLSADARQEWRRMAPELVRLKLLTSVDRGVFAGYCIAWGIAKAAQAIIAVEGIMAEGAEGGVKRHPAVEILNTALTTMHKFAVEFGFTPSARARLGDWGTDKGGDELDAFAKSKRGVKGA